jgi:hypothetical protein
MKRKPKKLSLSRETLGSMEEGLMKNVAGATLYDTVCLNCTEGTQCSACCTRTVCSVCCP